MKKVLTLGQRIDAHHGLYLIRKVAEQGLNTAKAAEKESGDALLKEFEESKIEGARGEKAQLSIQRREFAEITDFAALCKYVKRHDAFDLLRRQVNIGALRERIDAGIEVPGTQVGFIKVLNLTSIK